MLTAFLFLQAVKKESSQLKSPKPPVFCAPGGAIRAAKSVGSLVLLALSACSGTLEGSDKMDVALLRSRSDDKAAGNRQDITNTML